MKSLISIVLAVIALCIGAQINIDFQGSLAFLSISLISFVVLLIPFTINLFESTTALAIYIILAIIGLPVLSSGLTGIHVLSGPTLGYLIGFFLAVIAVSFKKSSTKNFWRIFALFIFGHILILSVGVPYYMWRTEGISLNQMIFPFLPGMFLKSLMGAGIVNWKYRRKLVTVA